MVERLVESNDEVTMQTAVCTSLPRIKGDAKFTSVAERALRLLQDCSCVAAFDPSYFDVVRQGTITEILTHTEMYVTDDRECVFCRTFEYKSPEVLAENLLWVVAKNACQLPEGKRSLQVRAAELRQCCVQFSKWHSKLLPEKSCLASCVTPMLPDEAIHEEVQLLLANLARTSPPKHFRKYARKELDEYEHHLDKLTKRINFVATSIRDFPDGPIPTVIGSAAFRSQVEAAIRRIGLCCGTGLLCEIPKILESDTEGTSRYRKKRSSEPLHLRSELTEAPIAAVASFLANEGAYRHFYTERAFQWLSRRKCLKIEIDCLLVQAFIHQQFGEHDAATNIKIRASMLSTGYASEVANWIFRNLGAPYFGRFRVGWPS